MLVIVMLAAVVVVVVAWVLVFAPPYRRSRKFFHRTIQWRETSCSYRGRERGQTRRWRRVQGFLLIRLGGCRALVPFLVFEVQQLHSRQASDDWVIVGWDRIEFLACGVLVVAV